jgi:hypothetical protein
MRWIDNTTKGRDWWWKGQGRGNQGEQGDLSRMTSASSAAKEATGRYLYIYS